MKELVLFRGDSLGFLCGSKLLIFVWKDFRLHGVKGSVTPGVTLMCIVKFRGDIWK